MKIFEKNREGISYPVRGATKRVLSGSFVTILGEGIGSLKHILLVPLFLRAWGKLVYGEWLTIYALVAYLPLVDIGMHNYVVNRLNQAYSKGDLEEYIKIFQSALRLYLAIIGIVSLIFAILILLTPFNRWFNIVITDSSTLKLTTLILGIYLLFSIPYGLILGLYHSFGEYPRRMMLSNLGEIILISLLIIVLYFGGDFIIVSFLHFVPMITLVSYCIWDINRRHKEVRFGFSSADWKLSWGFVGPGLLFLMISLAYAFKIQGSLLVISSILGAGAVAIFSIHRTLANLITKIVNSINCAFWPELTAAEAREDHKKIEFAHNFIIKFSLFLSFSFAIFLFFAGKDIIRIWTRGKIEFQPLLWLLFLLYLPVNTFWETSGIFQLSTNRHEKYAWLRFISAIVGILFAIISAKIWGIVGALSGFIIAELIICGWFIPSETLKIINLNKMNFWFNTTGKCFLIILPQILVGWIVRNFISNIILQWILLIAGIFIIGFMVSYLFWLNDEEKKKISINRLFTLE